MVGIVSYGAYIPMHRVNLAEAGKGRGEKAVANFDEDSITMGVAAAMDCLTGLVSERVDGLYFATITSPYAEKQAASIVATAADLSTQLLTADLTDSLKAGTTALRMAADSVAAGSARQILVVASDLRKASPGSSLEADYGDGAAALLIGNENVIARIEGSHSVALEILDVWRNQGDAYPRTGEDRFILSQGYVKTTCDAVKGLLSKLSLQPKDFTKLVLSGPDARTHADLVKAVAFDPKTQIEDPLFGKVGAAGAAHPLMILVSALEKAKAGDRILLAGYGNGADAISLLVTDEIAKLGRRRGICGHLESKRTVAYPTYLNWRDILPKSPAAVRPVKIPSSTALWREQDQVLRFHGVKCLVCGKIQYPLQRICSYCHTKDKFEPVKLARKRGELFTYSMDYVGGGKEVPMVVTVVNFEDGGRALLQMTDPVISEMKIGMKLELSFRKLREVSGIHNYFWKTAPIRIQEGD
jgi:3-hydroxy-3-methylglutaryl CoA synthase